MSKRIKSLSKLYHFYETDLWGTLTKKGKINKVTSHLSNVLDKRYNNSENLIKSNSTSYRIDLVKLQKKRRFESSYKKKLITRQRLRNFYGEIPLKKMKNYYNEALNSHTNVLETFLGLLESRLDVVIYRMNLASSIFHARQLVNHKHVSINKNFVNIPSYSVKPGDIIEINTENLNHIIKNIQSKICNKHIVVYVPTYIEVDYKILKGIFLRKPKLSEVIYPMAIDLSNITRAFKRT